VTRTERLLDLLALLVNARRPIPFSEIRQAFPADYGEGSLDSARRKFERDKRELVDVGLPIEWVAPASEEDEEDAADEGGGYLVDRRRAFLPELRLAHDEITLLYLAGLASAADPTSPYAEALRLALQKIELTAGPPPAGAPRGLHIDRSRSLASTGVESAPDAAVRARLALVTDAAHRRKRLSATLLLGLDGRGSAEREATLEPYGLFWRKGRWTLVAKELERGEVRLFPLHRLGAVRVHTSAPGSPDFELPSDFKLSDWARRAPHLRGVHPPLRVTLALVPEVRWLAERELGATSQPSADGQSAHMELDTTDLEALLRWVLAMGPRVEVVSPPEVRARVVQSLRRLAEVHA
jgi:proteasome accessory factor B